MCVCVCADAASGGWMVRLSHFSPARQSFRSFRFQWCLIRIARPVLSWPCPKSNSGRTARKATPKPKVREIERERVGRDAPPLLCLGVLARSLPFCSPSLFNIYVFLLPFSALSCAVFTAPLFALRLRNVSAPRSSHTYFSQIWICL